MATCFEDFYVSYSHGPFKGSENGTAKGLARVYPDPNAMHKDLVPGAKDGLVRARYEILSANTREYLQAAIKHHDANRWSTRGGMEQHMPIIGQVFSAQYNPESEFMFNGGILWGFDKLAGDAKISECKNLAYKEALKLNRNLQIEAINGLCSEVMGHDERDPFRDLKMQYLEGYRKLAEDTAQYADFMDCYVFVYIPDARKGSMPCRVNGLVTGRDGDMLKVMLLSHLDVPVFGMECLINRSADTCSVETLSRLHDIKNIKGMAKDIPYAKDRSVLSYPELIEYINSKRRKA